MRLCKSYEDLCHVCDDLRVHEKFLSICELLKMLVPVEMDQMAGLQDDDDLMPLFEVEYKKFVQRVQEFLLKAEDPDTPCDVWMCMQETSAIPVTRGCYVQQNIK
ncbi:hypothetical protein GEMRC1_011186 [Eukaryota sp. GEM-RC1]